MSLVSLLAAGCGGSSVRSEHASPIVAASGGPTLGAAGPPPNALPILCEDRAFTDGQSGHELLPGYAAVRDPRVANWIATLDTNHLIMEMMGSGSEDDNFNDMERSLDLSLADGSVIRGFYYRNGSRGLNLAEPQIGRPSDSNNYSTAFPAESVRGASFDTGLEWQVGEAIGDETLATQNELLRGPGVNLVRHPYWGNAEDAYGEDPYHAGRMGSAFTAGVQTHVAACAEHFLAHNIEGNLSNVNAVVLEQTLREIYGRPFEMVVRDGGVACVHAAANAVNGVKVVENTHLLRDILKGDVTQGGFGFRGFVISDYFAASQLAWHSDSEDEATAMANAGLDVDLPWGVNYDDLPQAVADGRVAPGVIAEAAGRVLEQKTRFGAAMGTDPYGLGSASSTLDGSSIATNSAHLALAERAERESAVLLQNGSPDQPTLPIPPGVGTVAVIGAEVNFRLQSTTNPRSCPDSKSECTFHFATDVALGDRGSNRVNADPAQAVAPFAGIQAAADRHGANAIAGTTAAAATDADFVVVVVGLTPGDESEGYASAKPDRRSLDLPADQATLVQDVLALHKPTAIVIESGSIVNLPWLSDSNRNQATIWAGYGGMRAGLALGELLFGDANFSGKLPLTWPKESELPAFTGDGTDTVLDLFFGYRDYDRRETLGEPVELVFPFGHGLSYTTFAYSHPSVPCVSATPGAVLDVSVDIENTGAMDGDEVAFLFVEGPLSVFDSSERSVRELKSFTRTHLPRGAKQRVILPLRIQDLRHWSGDASGSWILDPGEYRALVGPRDEKDALLSAGTFTISE